MTNSTVNAPVVALRTGGAVLDVLSHSASYVDPSHPLAPKDAVGIARFVQELSENNTEDSVGKMVDVVAFHGVKIVHLRAYVTKFGVERTHFVVQYLFEDGFHGHRTNEPKIPGKAPYAPNRHVESLLELLEEIDAIDGDHAALSSGEILYDLLVKLGGLSKALNMSPLELERAIRVIENDNVEDVNVDDNVEDDYNPAFDAAVDNDGDLNE